MSELANAIDVTVAGMGVVVFTLAVLALLVKGLGAVAGDRRTDQAGESDMSDRTQDSDDGDDELQAAAIAAVIAVLTEEQTALPAGHQLSGWVSGARIDAVHSRTRFSDRKEHQAWRGRSR